MPGPLLHVGAVVQCAHGGMAQPMVPYPRVLLTGQPAVQLSSPYSVAACALPPQAGGPCVTAQWVVGTVRVLATGVPLLIQGGVAVCVPTGTPLVPSTVQPRVIAT
jgi:hypothetical protein